MQGYGLKFDHLGLATRNPDRAIAFLRGLGYRTGAAVYDPLQRVNLVLCESDDMPSVEVISPAGRSGPLETILSERSEIVYHLCFRSGDAASSLDAMRRAGHRVMPIGAPQPAVLFGNRKVSFHMIKGFGLIEMLE